MGNHLLKKGSVQCHVLLPKGKNRLRTIRIEGVPGSWFLFGWPNTFYGTAKGCRPSSNEGSKLFLRPDMENDRIHRESIGTTVHNHLINIFPVPKITSSIQGRSHDPILPHFIHCATVARGFGNPSPGTTHQPTGLSPVRSSLKKTKYILWFLLINVGKTMS